ncbi:MAG: DUF3108 domain-containing protein [Alloprevotella sp.]|nr:DUF3108 domain-containing protein [Alloprevotella sp.]
MKRQFVQLMLLVFALTNLFSLRASAQCASSNTAFNSGETLVFDLYFNWKFVWIKVGNATWSVSKTSYKGTPAYRTRLITRTNQKADHYFVMRDTLISYVAEDLHPLYYEKNAKEGKQYRQEKVRYTYPQGQCKVGMYYRRDYLEPRTGEFESRYCAYDMVSMMLRARSFDATKYDKGYRQKFLLAEGRHTEWRTLLYCGKETIKMEGSDQQFRCLVFSYLETENGKESEIVRFYVTDDENHLPVRLDMNLRFGTAKAYLTGWKNVRHPVTALVSK